MIEARIKVEDRIKSEAVNPACLSVTHGGRLNAGAAIGYSLIEARRY
jgi:hypothetical protein